MINSWNMAGVFISGILLTFDHVLNICGVLQDLGQAIQQHWGLAVAIGDIFCLLEHLIQSCWLHLKHREPQQALTQRAHNAPESVLSLEAFRMIPWLVSDTHHLHSVIVDELLCGDAVDLIHKALLIREEVVELVGQLPTERDAAFVALIQILHHWDEMGRDINTTNTSSLKQPSWCEY